MSSIPSGPERERAAMTMAMNQALDHVGLMQMVVNAFVPDTDLPAIEEIQVQMLRMLAALESPVDTPHDAVRLVLSMQLIVNAVELQTLNTPFDVTLPREELIAYAVDLAHHTLHGPTR